MAGIAADFANEVHGHLTGRGLRTETWPKRKALHKVNQLKHHTSSYTHPRHTHQKNPKPTRGRFLGDPGSLVSHLRCLSCPPLSKRLHEEGSELTNYNLLHNDRRFNHPDLPTIFDGILR